MVFGHLCPPTTECTYESKRQYEVRPHGEIVSQKLLTPPNFSYYNIYMANNFPTEKQITIIGFSAKEPVSAQSSA